MTLYNKIINVENTYNSPSNYKKIDFEVKERFLFRIEVRFPPGPSALLHLALFYGEQQIFPYPSSDWIVGDDESIFDYPMLLLPESPCKLQIRAYNEDPNYDHSFILRILALPSTYYYGILALMKVGVALRALA